MRKLLSRGYIDPNFPNPGREDDTTFIIYGYTPSLAFAVVGATSFGLCALAALLLLFRFRTTASEYTAYTFKSDTRLSCRWSWIVFLTLVATLFEIVGYISRSLSSKVDPYRLPFFVVQYFFIVTAPVFISAAIYLAFGQLIKLVAGNRSPVSPRAVFGTFLGFDIVTTIIQIAGAASIGSAESNGKDPTPANNALLAGLAVQVVSFGVYLVIFVVCILKFRKLPKEDLAVYERNKGTFFLLFAVAALVEIRTVFRLVETAQGVYGYLSSNEPFFGCLEYLPIFLAVAGVLWLSQCLRLALLKEAPLSVNCNT